MLQCARTLIFAISLASILWGSYSFASDSECERAFTLAKQALDPANAFSGGTDGRLAFGYEGLVRLGTPAGTPQEYSSADAKKTIDTIAKVLHEARMGTEGMFVEIQTSLKRDSSFVPAELEAYKSYGWIYTFVPSRVTPEVTDVNKLQRQRKIFDLLLSIVVDDIQGSISLGMNPNEVDFLVLDAASDYLAAHGVAHRIVDVSQARRRKSASSSAEIVIELLSKDGRDVIGIYPIIETLEAMRSTIVDVLMERAQQVKQAVHEFNRRIAKAQQDRIVYLKQYLNTEYGRLGKLVEAGTMPVEISMFITRTISKEIREIEDTKISLVAAISDRESHYEEIVVPANHYLLKYEKPNGRIEFQLVSADRSVLPRLIRPGTVK